MARGNPVAHDPAALARLRQVRGLVLDMDGTLVLGDWANERLAPLPGAVELVDHLRRNGLPLVVLTNGTARPPAAYTAILRGIGFDLPDSGVLTPSLVAAEVCLRAGHARVMVLGGEGVAEPLRRAGIEVVAPEGAPSVDAVLVGWFRQVRFEHLEAACAAVWGGAQLYSASQSLYFATAGGRSLGTSRAICAVITDLTGRRPKIVGKPSLVALRSAARRLGVRPDETAVVGDDPDLEVPMAHRGHALAVSVGTGIARAGSFSTLAVERRPHLELSGVDELLRLYRRRNASRARPDGGRGGAGAR
ncbi:MAG: HAD-IIA family hydrolase [Acidimicrobiales bacterium]